ncbi:MAG: hypothetical protein OXI63_01585 [Candidatus Poribacteria bacterium]|nr:hypothetical protein [Candidatus Poribacteria bacterium]
MDVFWVVFVIVTFVVIAILKAILAQPEEKRDKLKAIRIPSRSGQRQTASQTKAKRLRQERSPLQSKILEKGYPAFSELPPPIPEYVSDPFDYHAAWWKAYSTWYRNEKGWTCEICQISLNDDRYYLHTHHVWGTQFNDPEDLMALCIACHSEQPGGHHSQLKANQAYHDFMTKYGKQWRFRRYH